MTRQLDRQQVRPDIQTDSIIRPSAKQPDAHALVGQDRAERSLAFGLSVDGHGFNVFVSGPAGIGKLQQVESYVREAARAREAPQDALFVHNHEDPYRPRLIMLPAGKGREFSHEIDDLRRYLSEELPRVFESDEYSQRSNQALQQFKRQGEDAGEKIQAKAREHGFTMQQTLMGMALVPIRDGAPMSDEEIDALSDEEQAEIQQRREKLQQEIVATQKQYRKINRKAQHELADMDRQVVASHIEGPLSDLQDEFGGYIGVSEYLNGLAEDVQNNVETLKSRNTDGQNVPPQIQQQLRAQQETFFSRFSVNVAVDNARCDGAPVVVERNPTYSNLVGTVEKEMQMGALTTDFTMVKAGAILRANGGFLVLPLRDLLRNPYGWEALKRSIDAARLQIEELQEQLGLMSIKSLKPQAVPLDIKVVLVGDPLVVQLLQTHDPGFSTLFKVRADLDTRMDDTPQNRDALVSSLVSLAAEEGISEISNEALSVLVSHAVREAGRHERLSIRMQTLHDVVREADFWTREDGKDRIEASHMERALDERVYRSALISDKALELIEDGTILIDTKTRRVGQANGLSVLSQGEISFGRPMRITASIGPGREGVVDIERQTELGGPVHNKGVMIITGYLSRLAAGRPLAMSARLVFEQSYAPVDGDSASLAELIALISALADTPLRQDIAITGSVNQHGDAQAIGGVNEKIEGYYDACRLTELSGTQGVVIPASNIQNLMLRPDVATAIDDGRFHVWSVETIVDAVELLAGRDMKAVTADVVERIDTFNEAIRGLSATTTTDS